MRNFHLTDITIMVSHTYFRQSCSINMKPFSILFSSLYMMWLMAPTHALTVLIEGDWYYKSVNGIYYFIPNKPACPHLKLNNEKSQLESQLMVSRRDFLVHLMPEYDRICFGGEKKNKKNKKKFIGCEGKSCSAVATLYNLIPGGGEKYLLSIVRAMQKLQQTVDILVLPGNSCASRTCVMQTAKAVNVEINWKRANVVVVEMSNSYFRSYLPHYNYFASLGNEKIPVLSAIGDMNFYMNQFPFDLNRPVTADDAHRLSTYDWVVVNSKYTMGWYSHYLNHSAVAEYGDGKIMPQQVVIYPPVTVSQSKPVTDRKKPWIVLTGRFFEGVQGKHHNDALETFRILKSKLPSKRIKLFLIGFQMPGHTEYTQGIEKLAAEIGDVHLFVNAEPYEIRNIISQASVVWSMTGGFDFVEFPAHNPADAEHFGISILEAMSAGCIPIVVGRGGLVEIVGGDASLMCYSPVECAFRTKRVLQLKKAAFLRKVTWAQKRPALFSDEVFDKQVINAFSSCPFSSVNQFIRKDIREQRQVVPTRSPYAAMIVETRSAILFRSVVSHNIRMLGGDWKLVVFHGSNNGDYCREALSHLSNVVYKDIGLSSVNDSSYNTLFKDFKTWEFLLDLGISKVLVFQLDSLILKPTVHEFLHFDYIGAPWTVDNDVYSGVNEYKQRIPPLPKQYRVGNGGLSLRNVEAMLSISKLYGNTSASDEQEDVFFVRYLNEWKYHVANITAALKFAVEVPIEGIKYDDLFGIHQTWNFVPSPTFDDILKPILYSKDSISMDRIEMPGEGMIENCVGFSVLGRVLCHIWANLFPI